MNAQMENFIREKAILRKRKIKILKIKKIISDTDNSFDWLISRIERADRRFNKLEDGLIKLVEVTQTKHKVEKIVKKENPGDMGRYHVL